MTYIFKKRRLPGTCLVTNKFSDFDQINLESLKTIISNIKPKQSFSDPIPVWLLKECSGLLYPLIINVVNKSLAEGIFPDTLKRGIVIPIVKDKLKDKNDLKGYRPVSTGWGQPKYKQLNVNCEKSIAPN